jgi:ABC-2 type transport system permease protein
MKKFLERYRYSVILLKQLVKTDFKLRYQGSVLGYVWSLLKPLLMFVVLYLVFSWFIGKPAIPHYSVYLLLGIVLWNYFVEVTMGSVKAIVERGSLLRKINFPKYVIVLAGSFSALINLLLNFVVIGIFMAFNHIALTWLSLLIIPLVFELFVFAIGLAFFLSALYVKFRDISYIWEVVMQAGFYAVPILYLLNRPGIPHRVSEIMIINPIAQIIQDARYVLITKQTITINYVFGGDKWIWLIPITLSLIIVVSAGLYFRARSRYFAEEA